MKKRLLTMLLALVAIMMPIGAWAYNEPESVQINIGTSGVATLYYGAHNLVIPEGVSASVITGVDVNEDGTVTVTEQVVDNIIPFDCAVILRGESGSYEFLIEEDPVEDPESNLLRGTDEPTTETEEGYLYFTLDSENGENSASLKDWIYVGNKVDNEAHKAYLALPEGYCPELAEMLGALKNPHLQHTHGGCQICGQVTGVEAAWYESEEAEAPLGFGTLAEAFEAAYTYDEENETYSSTEVHYIQLLSDVTSESGYFVYGGTFTLDLNGKTLQSSTTTLIINGGNVTFTDGSEKQTGKVATTSEGAISVCVESGNPTITIMEGLYEAVNREALEIYSGSVTIRGGEFTTAGLDQIVSVIDSDEANPAPSLTIMGGTFVAQKVNQIMYINGNTTISGGTFVGGNYSTVWYVGGTLSFVATEATDETPGFSPMGLRVEYTAEASINLPDGYGIYNENDEPQGELVTDMVYCYIGKTGGVSYTVTFSANYDTEATMDDAIVTSPTGRYALPECTFSAPEGKMFKAWLVGGVEYQPGEVIYVTSDTEVKAVWAVPYIVSFDANGGESDMDAIVTLSDATLPECTFNAPEGKMFKAWLVDGVEYQPYEMITVSADTEVKAVWTEYVPQIVIKMHDSCNDGWHGDAIVVKKNGEEIGTATIKKDGADGIVRYEYDNTAEYTFYWQYTEQDYRYPNECSFKIFIDDEQLFTADESDCENYVDGELIHTIEGEAIVVESLTIVDGELYKNYVSTTVGTLTYTRTLPNLMWNALYVPFEIPVSALTENYDVAYVNDIRSYDENEDGVLDRMTMEIIKLSSGTLHANHPYLIRAKNEDAKNMNLVLTDATLYKTEENSFTCSSMYMEFTVTGSYNSLSAEELEGKYAISEDGAWQLLNEGTTLKPFRLYLEMTARDGSPVKVESAALSRIRISVQGEEDGATGIEMVDTPQHEADGAFFDLSGRKVKAPVKGGIYIRNGKKILVK